MTDPLRTKLYRIVTFAPEFLLFHTPEEYLEKREEFFKSAIAQIVQAFADEGYKLCTNMVHAYRLEDDGRLTSQEWVERFEKEMHFFADAGTLTPATTLKVAKRAAGLKDGDE